MGSLSGRKLSIVQGVAARLLQRLIKCRKVIEMKLITTLLVVVTACFSGGFALADNDRLARALAADNHFILMRHALAPGTGDPSNFTVSDCETQRNLDDIGRAQAVAIGEFLNSLPGLELKVYSSQWCRCMETARLLELGAVTELPEINSFYADRSTANSQTQATIDWLAVEKMPVLLVTHQVNITALTGVYPSSGEIVVVKREDDGALIVIGSMDL